MSLLAKSRHYFVNGSVAILENGLLNLASDFYDTVYVRIDFQADNRCVFQMLVIDRSIVMEVCRNARCTSFFVHHYTNLFTFFKLRSFEDFFDLCVPSI